MRALFTVSLLELFIGGGGRLTAVGPVSLRMLLFGLCLCAMMVGFLFPRRRSDGVNLALVLVLVYLILEFGGLLTGGLQGEKLKQILAEFQQSLYWLAAPFYALMLQTRGDLERCSRLVRIAGIALAVLYLGIVTALVTGLISFGVVQAVVRDSGELTVRSGEFFVYKGFLYLGVGIVFFIALRPRFWVLATTVLIVALVLTFTRGFLVSTAAAVMLLLVAQRRWYAVVPAVALAAAGAAFIWIYLPSTDTSMGDKYQASSNQRIEDMTYILYHTKPSTLLLGEGFGTLINNRLQIENTYLWALWKLGIFGLLFWLIPLVLCLVYYSRIPNRSRNSLANAYLFGTILVYLQTGMNPFLNNPIGLSFVLLALFSLRVLSKESWGAAPLARVPARLPSPSIALPEPLGVGAALSVPTLSHRSSESPEPALQTSRAAAVDHGDST